MMTERDRVERIEDLEFMASWGVSLSEAGRRLGVSADAVERFLQRNGRSDLCAVMRPRNHNLDNSDSHGIFSKAERVKRAAA